MSNGKVKEITITVSGPTGAGKTQVLAIIAGGLLDGGFLKEDITLKGLDPDLEDFWKKSDANPMQLRNNLDDTRFVLIEQNVPSK